MKKYIYDFGKAGYNLVHLLGGKGAGLGEMVKMGLNVPPGFTITTEAGKLVEEGEYSDIQDQILLGVKRIEKKTSKNFGNLEDPLLLSVRSGAPVSMPGIMETILFFWKEITLIIALIAGIIYVSTRDDSWWDKFEK